MSNTHITDDVIAKTALYNVENNAVMADCVYRGHTEEFAKKGSSVRVRRPLNLVSVNGKVRQNQDLIESTIPLTVDQQEHVSFTLSQIDRTLTIEKFNERYAKPAGIAISNAIDEYLAGLYYKFWLSGGTPGTTPRRLAPRCSNAHAAGWGRRSSVPASTGWRRCSPAGRSGPRA